MAMFVIADLHLSSDGSKSMEVFGPRWRDYRARIERNWRAVITDEDTVILPGDLCWSLRLEETAEEFRFLESLPGQKLIGKGNHDFWWSTVSKMSAYLEKIGIRSVRFLYNNAYLLEDRIVCGTRGWFLEEAQQHTVGEVDYARILNREVGRLRMSLEAARRLQVEDGRELPILVFLHFPPVWGDFICREILDLLHEFSVDACYFGHIHGAYHAKRCTEFEGIDFVLCAADYLNFAPMPL